MDPKEMNDNTKPSNIQKKSLIKKISEISKRAKLYLKDHFPKRVWPKPQEKRKGPKF